MLFGCLGGHGGWGKDGEEEPTKVLDKNDPNYNSDEDDDQAPAQDE
jgi:hypothetical protein